MIVADDASPSLEFTHTHTLKPMTGGAEVLKGVTALSGSVPPCPLLPTANPSFRLPLRGHGAHRHRLTPEVSSYRYGVSAREAACVRVIMRMRGLLIPRRPAMCWRLRVRRCLCALGATVCVMELLTPRTWTRTAHRF